MTGRSVAMLVYNDLVHDARVFKEASSLRDVGYAVRVIGMSDDASGEPVGWDGIDITRLHVGVRASLRTRYATFWRQAYGELLTAAPDVVHAHDLDVLAPAWIAARRLGVPIVHDAHELWVELPSLVGRPHVRAVWSLLARALVPWCDAVITVSGGIANEIETRYGVHATVLRNVPLAGDDVAPAPLREQLGVPAGAALVLFQGGLLPGVGIDRAISAIDHLPDAHLIIIGDGPLREDIQRMASGSPARERIHVLPAVPFTELRPITRACDVGVHLGTSQGLNVQFGLPNKLFDYIAAGIPSVVTDWPEQGGIVRTHDVGRVVPVGASPEEVARAIEAVVADADRYRVTCGVAAGELVWERESERLLDVYERLPWRVR